MAKLSATAMRPKSNVLESFAADTSQFTPGAVLPPDDALRLELHNEVHARPPASIRLPALVVCVAVLNEGVSREEEWAHLRQLPGLGQLPPEELHGLFLRLQLESHTLKWERHSEFTRYSIVQPLPNDLSLGSDKPALLESLVTPPGWLRAIPGRTVAAIELAMIHADLPGPTAVAQRPLMDAALRWFDGRTVMASQLGGGHSWALADFQLNLLGFEQMLVLAPADTSESRAGRISQRLLEMETYRIMALRGLPVAKALAPTLASAERQLATITARTDDESTSAQDLLDDLVNLAGQVESAIAQSTYRFSATRAYDAIVSQRISELRELPIPGSPSIGTFMHRRLSPAMATVASTSQRLASLSERVSRASALLRTRVDIETEAQNQQLLEKLTHGQEVQLRLQTTVEGLSIAAIAYYVVSLLLYLAKFGKAAGLPIQPEVAAGALVPLVLWAVWRTTRRIHAKIHARPHG